GTAFALATSFLGNNIEVSGNVGYGSQSGSPTAGFRTSFSHKFANGQSPEISVAMRQIFLAGRPGSTAFTGQDDGLPTLRSMSIGLRDKVKVLENAELTYGATLESVQFLGHMSYVSPYARLSYDLEGLGVLEFGYSSGLPPIQLYATAHEGEAPYN